MAIQPGGSQDRDALAPVTARVLRAPRGWMHPRASDRIAATRRALLVAPSATGKSVTILEGVSEFDGSGFEETVAELVEVVA